MGVLLSMNAPLAHTRVLSLALNLPGPAALLRCAQMGAQCTKLEPPPAPGQPSADPMGIYSPAAYGELHQGVRVLHATSRQTKARPRCMPNWRTPTC